jgi:hypothetical protein
MEDICYAGRITIGGLVLTHWVACIGIRKTRTIPGSFQLPFANPVIQFFFRIGTGVHQLSKIVEKDVFF